MLTDLYVITVFLKNCLAFIFRVKLLDAEDEEDLNLQQHCFKNLRSCRRNTSLEMLVMFNKTIHHCHQQEKGLSVLAYADITSV